MHTIKRFISFAKNNQIHRVMKSSFFSLMLTIFALFSGCNQKSKNINDPYDDWDFTQHPNVIILITDDQGYGDLGCHGNPWIETPTMDKIYNESVRLTNFHVGTTCAPTRAGLMSGKNCNRVGVWHTVMGRSLLDKEAVILPELYKDNGYTTAIFGKWHLGDNYPYRPQDRGFDEVFIHGGGGIGQTPDVWNNDYFDDVYLYNGYKKKVEGYCTDVWFDAALEFIETNKNKPFFCYLSTNAPHGPYHVPEKYISMYDSIDEVPNANFYGMITNIDENLAVLEQKLEQWNLRDNTVLIFMTDNGTSSGADLNWRGMVSKGFNAGMRGKKGSEYEGGHRVPFFIRWPEKGISGGIDVDMLTSYTDVMPTLVDLCSLGAGRIDTVDGISLVPYLNDTASAFPDRAIITDTQREELPEKWKNSSVMTQRWRLIRGYELYDMERDPGQSRNVAGYYPSVVRRLRNVYNEWWEELEPGFDEYPEIILGADKIADELTAHDWHTSDYLPPWNQDQIRAGAAKNGFWIVDVAEAGKYEFKLRRWPAETAKALGDSILPGDSVSGGNPYQGGRTLDIVWAKIQYGEIIDSVAVTPEDPYARFVLSLKPGESKLQTWFREEDGTERGAFYVYVNKMQNQ